MIREMNVPKLIGNRGDRAVGTQAPLAPFRTSQPKYGTLYRNGIVCPVCVPAPPGVFLPERNFIRT